MASAITLLNLGPSNVRGLVVGRVSVEQHRTQFLHRFDGKINKALPCTTPLLLPVFELR